MFTTIEDFLTNWEHESGSTYKILDALTNESLAQEVSPQDRTVGRIAWHIVTTLDEMMGRTGLNLKRHRMIRTFHNRLVKLLKHTEPLAKQWS